MKSKQEEQQRRESKINTKHEDKKQMSHQRPQMKLYRIFMVVSDW